MHQHIIAEPINAGHKIFFEAFNIYCELMFVAFEYTYSIFWLTNQNICSQTEDIHV